MDIEAFRKLPEDKQKNVEEDIEKLRLGMRIQAVWKPKEERVGDWSDIRYFKVIED